MPLTFLCALGDIRGYFAGAAAFGFTGSDVAPVIVHTFGVVVAWGLVAAVATVYYRNLIPAA